MPVVIPVKRKTNDTLFYALNWIVRTNIGSFVTFTLLCDLPDISMLMPLLICQIFDFHIRINFVLLSRIERYQIVKSNIYTSFPSNKD